MFSACVYPVVAALYLRGIAVSVKSEKSKPYYQTQLYGNGQKGEGWIPAAGTVTINVIASDTDWSIEAVK